MTSQLGDGDVPEDMGPIDWTGINADCMAQVQRWMDEDPEFDWDRMEPREKPDDRGSEG